MTYDTARMLDLASEVTARAQKRGAGVAECVVSQGARLSTRVRLGEPELVKEAGSKSAGLRIMLGQKVAVTVTTDLSASGLARLVDDALELAELSQPDPFAGPPDPALLSKAHQHPDLDLFDPALQGVDGREALTRAKEAEQAALAFDPRIKNSEGATFARQSGASALVTSGGFAAASQGTYASIVVSPVVDDEGGKKRRGFHWSARTHLADLDAEAAVGREAARRTLQKLGARKVATQQAPVIFDPDAAGSMLGLIAGCVNGGAIWRRSSYLVDRLGSEVASKLVSIVDDPTLARGPGSQPYDGEGLLARKNVVVEGGVLRSYLLDSYAGRKLSMESTASASRGSSAGVGVGTSNFILLAGQDAPEDILKSTARGLYVTEMMGYGFNAVTGDFSRGASGFWIENGELAFPVSEVTISLNLDQILKRIDAVGSDLDLKSSVAAPTFRVSEMTIAGT